MKAPLFLTILLTTSLVLIQCEQDAVSLFFKGYDRATRPDFEKGQPTIIRSSIYVESFGNIEEANMEYKVYTYFRQLWKDSRLAGKLNRTFTIKGGEIDNIWVPDPFCSNARESNMMMPNEEIHSFVHIKPNGDIVFSKGVTLLASCVMSLQHFPVDSQKCHLTIGSYAYSTKDIVYEWISEEVQVGNKEMAQFEYKGAKLTSDIEVFSVGNFSTITVTFFFQRRLGYYLIQVYFPTIFVVMLSWIVFFMEKDDIGNRMALGITTILTIMFLLGSLNGNLPKVSYPKALDWYLLISFSFVFLSLIECMIVYVFTLKATADEQQIECKKHIIPLSKRISSSLKSNLPAIGWKTNTRSPKDGNTNMENGEDLEMVYSANNSGKAVLDNGSLQENMKNNTMEKIANVIDSISRFLFPLAFVGYNIFYWTYY